MLFNLHIFHPLLQLLSQARDIALPKQVPRSTMATQPKVKLQRLAYVHYQYPDLKAADNFLNDFGVRPVETLSDKTYYLPLHLRR